MVGEEINVSFDENEAIFEPSAENSSVKMDIFPPEPGSKLVSPKLVVRGDVDEDEKVAVFARSDRVVSERRSVSRRIFPGSIPLRRGALRGRTAFPICRATPRIARAPAIDIT